MNIFKKLWIRLIYLKIEIFGDKDLVDVGSTKCKGEKVLPCLKCGQKFLSQAHWGHPLEDSAFIFDNLCEECVENEL